MKISYKPLIVGSIIIIAIWAFSFLAIRMIFIDYPKMGQFGDLFGSINALFSGLAFAGLIYTIYLQNNELKDTHDEIIKSAKKQGLQLHLDTLNAKLIAYSTILNPQAGMKNRTIDEINLYEDEIKKKFIETLKEIERINMEDE